MTNFIDLASTAPRFKPERVIGYSDIEIDYIGNLYDIVVVGQLRDFLSQIGRCAGNAMGDDQFFFYSRQSVRQQFGYQQSLTGRFHCHDKKYYFLGNSSNRLFVFLQTDTENPDRIFTFNARKNNELLATDKLLFDYVSECLKKSQSNIPLSFEGRIIP